MAPHNWENPGQGAVVRAWTSNPASLSVEVVYSFNYRFGSSMTYRAALSHFFSFTNLADTGATAGESVYANIVRNGPAMMATYVLS
ncbi:hypothetical protein IA539_15345 [Gordonia sp. zg691]|uniref:hypothetical protein n=1 Tax=Gordonia jinghuaiqii TaxID=2758710 RepID=UPI0016622EE5|nr:hypothetical protein [Gordonia jinghuaiqii]MBD0862578.1 hypothetical protein [Gordonia jinghuaiqii]